ncbi:MAG TPA: hypothetical protein VJZ93_01585 [Candidatus Nanoarchaeia archaeon]|nr:hypothetical protein [Candidatus Nanoarchaeia archaeon]
MAVDLTRKYLLSTLDSWKTAGEILYESGNGGNKNRIEQLEGMLTLMKGEGLIFSSPQGRSQTMRYILREKLSPQEIKEHKSGIK